MTLERGECEYCAALGIKTRCPPVPRRPADGVEAVREALVDAGVRGKRWRWLHDLIGGLESGGAGVPPRPFLTAEARKFLESDGRYSLFPRGRAVYAPRLPKMWRGG